MTSKGLMLLGPNEWDDDYQPRSPPWLRAYLNPLPAVATPMQIRQAMGVRIERESGGAWRGIVMDSRNQKTGEDDADFFRRLETQGNVMAYYFFVPNRSKIMGTAFEAGMLRRDFHYGQHPRIALFAEAGFMAFRDDGTVELAIKGKRTRYFASLIHIAEHVEDWRTLEEGFENVGRRARSHWGP